MGVLYVGQKTSLDQFSEMDERLVRTLANHAAVVLARQSLAAKAAQAEALREADVLKDRILSLASHEMRTPLAAIKASATGLLQSKEKYGREGSRDALRSIASEVDRLSNLIGNMLDLSRLEAGAWAPSKEWCDIEEIISTALDRMLEEDGARVEVTISPSIPLIYADYVQLAIVLTNLLSNAVKYGRDHAPILLNVAAAELIDGQPTITVSVRDFGAGFASGEETALFERFYRSQRHRASAIHGAGLGLSLCQAIIEAHEGKIWARNAAAPDESGAIFAFSLPVNEYESTKFQQTDIDR
jgi:two-component system sensor histidine kinase KdpD